MSRTRCWSRFSTVLEISRRSSFDRHLSDRPIPHPHIGRFSTVYMTLHSVQHRHVDQFNALAMAAWRYVPFAVATWAGWLTSD